MDESWLGLAPAPAECNWIGRTRRAIVRAQKGKINYDDDDDDDDDDGDDDDADGDGDGDGDDDDDDDDNDDDDHDFVTSFRNILSWSHCFV